MSPTQNPTHVSRRDRIAMITFMVIGTAIIFLTVVAAVVRIVEITTDSPVTVLARLSDTTVETPIGDNGASVTLDVSSAYLTAPLPTAAIWFLIMQQIVATATTVIVVSSLLLLSGAVLRGAVFSKRNTALVATAGVSAVIGTVVAATLENLGAAELLLDIAGPSFPVLLANFDPFTYILAAFAAGLITLVFVVGERLQRETEGLV